MQKSLPKSKQITYAIGQLGWATLSTIIGQYLIFFYMPPEGAGVGRTFIPQGKVVFGVLTIIGLITMLSRLIDAVTDPLIATLSDKSKNPKGRRIPFMKMAAIPFSLMTVLVFIPIKGSESLINSIWLAFALFTFYVFLTMYVTPYFALISELGHTPEERLNLSTYIAITFFLGMGLASTAPVLADNFQKSGMDAVRAYQVSFAILSVIALICMMVPVFSINEREYCDSVPSETSVLEALKSTFSNKDFLNFVISDLSYWLALTILQTGLLYYITTLLGMEETKFTVLFMLMGVLSFVFYPIVNLIARKTGKKKLLSIAFVVFIVAFIIPFFFNIDLAIPPMIQMVIMIVIASFPMAVFAILPNAVIADIAEYDAHITGNRKEGVFFAARTFMSKIGQMLSMLIFPSLITIGAIDGSAVGKFGVRLTGPVAAIFLVIGLIFFLKYDEEKIIKK